MDRETISALQQILNRTMGIRLQFKMLMESESLSSGPFRANCIVLKKEMAALAEQLRQIIQRGQSSDAP